MLTIYNNGSWNLNSTEVSRGYFYVFSYKESQNTNGKVTDKGLYFDLDFSIGLGLILESSIKVKLINLE